VCLTDRVQGYACSRAIIVEVASGRGGPMLMPTLVEGGVIWRFAGVITEFASGAGLIPEQVVAVRAHYIRPNGGIS
jgi:hypothetical protein